MNEAEFERARRLTKHLPGVEVLSHYGKPALKVNGKAFASPSREEGAIGVYCPVELKEYLIEARPDLYFETPHYHGWPGVLVHMNAIDDDTLQARLEAAWIERAPKNLLRSWRAEQEGEGGGEA